MVTGTSNRDAYITALEPAKVLADQQVQQAILRIEQELTSSMQTLKAAGQTIPLNIDEIVERLNTAKKDWLDHVSSTFDAAILRLKTNLASMP